MPSDVRALFVSGVDSGYLSVPRVSVVLGEQNAGVPPSAARSRLSTSGGGEPSALDVAFESVRAGRVRGVCGVRVVHLCTALGDVRAVRAVRGAGGGMAYAADVLSSCGCVCVCGRGLRHSVRYASICR